MTITRVCCTTVEMQESDVEELERRAIRVWMRTVMSSQGWSANEWAVKANTSPTNITRFLNSDATYIPTSRTLGKLAFVAGSNPQLINKGQEGGLIKYPVKNADGETVDMLAVEDENVEVYKLGYTTGMWAAGIMPNTIVVIKKVKPKEIENGDVLLFEDEKYGLLCCEFYEGSIFFKVVQDNSENQIWHPRKCTTITKFLVGKVIQSIKKF